MVSESLRIVPSLDPVVDLIDSNSLEVRSFMATCFSAIVERMASCWVATVVRVSDCFRATAARMDSWFC